MGMIALIACIDEFGAIGNKDTNSLQESFKEDILRFKELTYGNTVIMGSKTFESLNCKPLKNRKNIVITSDINRYCSSDDNVLFVSSLDDALNNADLSTSDAFIIGGGQIYQAAIKSLKIDAFYLTHTWYKHPKDTWFRQEDNKVYFPMSDLVKMLKGCDNVKYYTSCNRDRYRFIKILTNDKMESCSNDIYYWREFSDELFSNQEF